MWQYSALRPPPQYLLTIQTGGMIAAKMGVPIKLLAAVNTNDIVYQALNSGVFESSGDVFPSLSPAIDILVVRIRCIAYHFFSADSLSRIISSE